MGKEMEVLLLKPLVGKGNAGDVIDVKIHYANHFLIPNGYAIAYTKQVKNQREAQEKKIKKAKQELHKQVQSLAKELENGITFYKAATEEGGLYDSIDESDLADYVYTEHQLHLDKERFGLEEKIEELGRFTATFDYKDVSIEFPVVVKGKEDVE